MFEREEAIEEAAGEVAQNSQRDNDREECAGALHHDDAILQMEVGGEEQRIGKDDSANEKGAEAPGPWDSKRGNNEHAEAGGHAKRRHHDFPQRHGTAALANAPGEHAGKTDE